MDAEYCFSFVSNNYYTLEDPVNMETLDAKSPINDGEPLPVISNANNSTSLSGLAGVDKKSKENHSLIDEINTDKPNGPVKASKSAAEKMDKNEDVTEDIKQKVELENKAIKEPEEQTEEALKATKENTSAKTEQKIEQTKQHNNISEKSDSQIKPEEIGSTNESTIENGNSEKKILPEQSNAVQDVNSITVEQKSETLQLTTTGATHQEIECKADDKEQSNTTKAKDESTSGSPKSLDSSSGNAASALNDIEITVSKSLSPATINVLKKLFDDISSNYKLNSNQKGIVNECKNILNGGEIPCAKIIQLLNAADNNLQLKVILIDAISKVFSFENSTSEFNRINFGNYRKFSDLCIDTFSKIFKDETDDHIELQIVKTIVNIILNDSVEVHTSKLLEGVRLIYNIFILTVSENIKLIAEATLTQIIDYYFQKVEDNCTNLAPVTSNNMSRVNSIFNLPPTLNNNMSVIDLDNLENLNEVDEKKFSDIENNKLNVSSDNLNPEDLNVILIKDCFLIFRAMSKLSTKPLDETYIDVRSTAVRSKLLSLKILYSILNNHINCFLNKSITIVSNLNGESIPFIDSVRNYLLLSLAKNAVYQLNDIYSVCLDIFYIMITNLRADFINEIPVLFSEIFFPIVEMPVSTSFQKKYFLSIVSKLSNDPRLLIEFYLNFDCSANRANIIELLINYLIKTENVNLRNYNMNKKNDSQNSMTAANGEIDEYDPTALNCIVSILRSLYGWSNKGLNEETKAINGGHRRTISASIKEPLSPTYSITSNSKDNLGNMTNNNSSSTLNNSVINNINDDDDPTEFESIKKRKTLLLEYTKLFNYKPKKGLKKLIDAGFIKSEKSADVASFFISYNDLLDKEVLGEYLGEGDDFNINIMHEFVGQFDFSGMKFVDAMRLFLQSFRLPGESQKIDRFMLKFAETYFKSHTNSVFAQADTLYVLSYSIIMLNTDQHNDQVKSRMSVEDFIKNNSGIDDGKDLPRQLLVDIYNDISSNEIILESEQHSALITGNKNASVSTGLFSTRVDTDKEYYIQAAKEISSKTEKVIKSSNQSKKTKFFAANHVEHVKSIFDNLWMSFLAALTPSFKEFDNPAITKLCLEGIKLSIKIACIFSLDDARTSFVNALIQFMNLNNIEEIQRKNFDAINTLLDICVSDGNYLDNSWTDILICISQLDRLQLIAQGIDASNIPDIFNAKVKNSSDRQRKSQDTIKSPLSATFFGRKQTTPSEIAQIHHANQKLQIDIAELISSTALTVKIDKIFASTEKLSIEAITFFVKALTEVALEEVQSSGNSSNPRIFSVQKMVDICYYNMDRIRVEWSRLWEIMGSAFNKIGCDSNLTIVIFALDSLRQLSMRFFEIEELAYFKFQKDFLKPFAYILAYNESVDAKLMVLECVNNMVLAKSDKIKSGWTSIFDCISNGALGTNSGNRVDEQVLNKAYRMTTNFNLNYFDIIYTQNAFDSLVHAYTSLACNESNQRISLHAIADMRALIKKIQGYKGNKPEANDDNDSSNAAEKLRFLPVLVGFNEIILKNSDLESRSISLDHLFDSLVEYGDKFDVSTWKEISEDLLFPIFGVLKQHWSQLNSQDDLSVWLSTTLIQALKNMIALFTRFSSLMPMLGGYLSLLCSCILQENDTISRIGRNCLQTLLIQNCSRFNEADWKKVTKTIKDLFENTTAIELFLADPLRYQENNHMQIEKQYKQQDGILGNENFGLFIEDGTKDSNKEEHVDDKDEEFDGDTSTDTVVHHLGTASSSTAPNYTEEHRRKIREKGIIVVKCVLQLLMIETLSELFEDQNFYSSIPTTELFKLVDLLEQSYKFALEFNEDYNLRVRLWNSGVIERLPNLLKQESSSSGVYINVNFKLLTDSEKASREEKESLLSKLIPLCVKIIQNYIALDESRKQRNINTWRPVVSEILHGYFELDEDNFVKYCPIMYDLVLCILDKQIPMELRVSIKNFLTRVGEVYVRI